MQRNVESWKDVAERQLDAKCRSLSSLARRGISQDERSLKEWQLILVRELVARVIQALQKVNEPSNSHNHIGTRSDMLEIHKSHLCLRRTVKCQHSELNVAVWERSAAREGHGWRKLWQSPQDIKTSRKLVQPHESLTLSLRRPHLAEHGVIIAGWIIQRGHPQLRSQSRPAVGDR